MGGTVFFVVLGVLLIVGFFVLLALIPLIIVLTSSSSIYKTENLSKKWLYINLSFSKGQTSPSKNSPKNINNNS